MKKWFIFILIGILVLFAYLFIGPQISNQIQREEVESKRNAYLENVPSITITGVLQHWKPIDGPSYAIIPEEQMDVKMSYNGIYLYGEKLSSSLHDKKVTVTGKLIENYEEYQQSIGTSIFGGDPNTAVIFVSDIEIIENESSFIPEKESTQTIAISGSIKQDGATTLFPWYKIDHEIDILLDQPGEIKVIYQDNLGNVLAKTGFDISFTPLHGSQIEPDTTFFALKNRENVNNFMII